MISFYFLFLPATIPKFFWNFLIAFFVKVLYYLQTFLLKDSSPNTKFMIASQRSTSSELVVELTEVDKANVDEIESKGAHDAWFYSDEKDAGSNLFFSESGLHNIYTVYLAVS